MENILLFTHGIDIDGYGCAVLAKLAFNIPTIVFADNLDLDSQFMERYKRGDFKNYDQIFITDHCLSMETCLAVDKDKNLTQKLKIIDHHASRIEEQGSLSWVDVIDVDKNGKKCSGTSLFYEYLIKNKLIKRFNSYDKFVDLTRSYDTWEWTKTGNKDANFLNTLAMAMGRENYIESLTYKLEHNTKFFMFSAKDLYIVEEYNKAFEAQLENYVNQIKYIKFDGHKVGFVEIKDLFKNDIAQKIRQQPAHKNIDYLLMPVPERNTVSLRSINPNCDVSEIAQKFGGGGHKTAASFPLQNLQIKDTDRVK